MKPIHFSVTETKIASLCPRKFVINKKYRKKVFAGKTSGVGTLVHMLIAKFADKVVNSKRFILSIEDLAEKDVKKLFRNGMQEIFNDLSSLRDFSKWQANELELVGSSIETLASEMSDRYVQLKKQNNPEEAIKKLFVAVEWGFKHILEISINGKTKQIEIGGRIDWIATDTNNETITVWDFKTGSIQFLERDIAQVAIYSAMVEEKLEIETAAALMYIAGDTITTHRVEPDILEKFKPNILRIIYKMSEWMEEKEEIPYASYKEVCQDCIVSKFCFRKYGSNPHLEELGIKVETAIELEEATLLSTEEEDKKVTEEEVIPEKELIAREMSKITVDLTKTEEIDIKPYIKKETSNINIGKKLIDNKEMEIHPNVFLRHAVTLGASGSGKTVLGKVLIEEILNQGYSAILIDPQGDLCSLALPADDEGKKLVKKSKIKIYTPNSTKGIKLTIDPLTPPAPEVLYDPDTLMTYLDATSTLLLSILGYNLLKNPPEKTLLETILKEDWESNKVLDFKTLANRILEATQIRSVQDDSEVDIERLIGKTQQKKLSQNMMKLALGTEGSFFIGGESIDFDELTTKQSQLSIINLASVGTDQTKRQLVVSWILRMIYDWLLRNPQKEQDKIRFFLYIDEVADFLPAHPLNPPSKKMLMLLMRQARKYGCSVLLATQSPAAIEYKALDNVGTLFIGRIPTKQSIKKVEAFLEPYGHETQRMVKKVMTVKPGEFMMIGGGYTKPEMFKTRWLHTKHQILSLDDIEKMK